jgi:hypothetical protein
VQKLKMRNCPEEFYRNCSQQLTSCHVCCAGMGTVKHPHQYQPLSSNPDLLHPYTPPAKVAKKKPKNLVKSKEVKIALKREKSSVASLARSTLGSGRFRHDGDAIHLDALRVERKTRFKSRAVSVTSVELVKGKQQQIDVFEIDLPLCRETYYVLTEQTYQDLIKYVYNERRADASSTKEEISRASNGNDDPRCSTYSDGLCWL